MKKNILYLIAASLCVMFLAGCDDFLDTQNLTKKVAISNLRVFAMLDNFFTFSNYIGLDPETATTGGNALGFDMGNFPTAKSIIFGVNLEF